MEDEKKDIRAEQGTERKATLDRQEIKRLPGEEENGIITVLSNSRQEDPDEVLPKVSNTNVVTLDEAGDAASKPDKKDGPQNKVKVGTGSEKREMTEEEADAEVASALQEAQAQIVHIPGAEARIVDEGGGVRSVKVYIPNEYKHLYLAGTRQAEQVIKPAEKVDKAHEDLSIQAQPETSIEQQRFSIPIDDTREQQYPEQTEALQRRLAEDKVDVALLQTRQLLGGYARQEARDLTIKVIPGDRIGAGQVTDRLIDMEMPTPQQIEQMRQQSHPAFGVLEAEQYNNLVIAIDSSTVLHEGVHGLLDSRPNSQFAADLERTIGIENQYGQVSTLLDEGLAYAIQGLHAPNIEPIGSLAPQINPTDSFMEQTRKTLGKKLQPVLAEYIAQGKALDSAFFTQAGEMLQQLNLEQYIEEYKKRFNLQ